MTIASEHESDPLESSYDPVIGFVVSDFVERSAFGFKKYRTLLRPFNGRDPIVDAYQESIDQAMYIRQAIIELDAVRGACKRILPVIDVLPLGESAKRDIDIIRAFCGAGEDNEKS